ncbi:MAG: YqgE/AlgH family protein [Gammaproteobacteria bacterium]
MKSIAALLLVVLGASPVFAVTPATGTLLVATDELRDPRFSETVILLLHYGADGAVGVAINRPTWVDAVEFFTAVPIPDDYTGHIYFGGPVAPANLVTLVRIPDSGEIDLDPIVDDVYVGATPDFLSQAVVDADTELTLRLYAGYASWDSGQLDREIAAGSWRVVPASAELIFAAEPLELWVELHAPVSELTVYRLDDRPTLASR